MTINTTDKQQEILEFYSLLTIAKEVKVSKKYTEHLFKVGAFPRESVVIGDYNKIRGWTKEQLEFIKTQFKNGSFVGDYHGNKKEKFQPEKTLELLTLKMIANQANVSKSYLWHLLSNGKIPREIAVIKGNRDVRGWTKEQAEEIKNRFVDGSFIGSKKN